MNRLEKLVSTSAPCVLCAESDPRCVRTNPTCAVSIPVGAAGKLLVHGCRILGMEHEVFGEECSLIFIVEGTRVVTVNHRCKVVVCALDRLIDLVINLISAGNSGQFSSFDTTGHALLESLHHLFHSFVSRFVEIFFHRLQQIKTSFFNGSGEACAIAAG